MKKARKDGAEQPIDASGVLQAAKDGSATAAGLAAGKAAKASK